MRAGRRIASGGFALVLLLFAVAVVATAASMAAASWSRDMARDKEAELLRIGDLYARAIAAYYLAGLERRYPSTLDELLDDRRQGGLRRHLRALYPDPATGGDWGLVRAPDGGIMGVHSTSMRATWRRAPVTLDHISLPAAQVQSEWKFIARVS